VYKVVEWQGKNMSNIDKESIKNLLKGSKIVKDLLEKEGNLNSSLKEERSDDKPIDQNKKILVKNKENIKIKEQLSEQETWTDEDRENLENLISAIQIKTKRLEEIDVEIERLENENIGETSMNTEISKEKSIHIDSEDIETKKVDRKNNINEIKENLPDHIDFYLSTPNKDGSFYESSARKNYTEGASVYSFKNIGNNRFEVYINQDERSYKLLLSYPDVAIDPVFDGISGYNRNAKTLQTIIPAIVELNGGKFVLISKGEMDYDKVGIERENKK
jgi:hypothetical protein